MKIRTVIAADCAALAFSVAGSVSAREGEAETVTERVEAIISDFPGRSMIAVEVDLAPGAASAPHTRAKSAFICAYVILGAIESTVIDGETGSYRAGESWSEPPDASFSISRDASTTRGARPLAVSIAAGNDNALTVPVE